MIDSSTYIKTSVGLADTRSLKGLINRYLYTNPVLLIFIFFKLRVDNALYILDYLLLVFFSLKILTTPFESSLVTTWNSSIDYERIFTFVEFIATDLHLFFFSEKVCRKALIFLIITMHVTLSCIFFPEQGI